MESRLVLFVSPLDEDAEEVVVYAGWGNLSVFVVVWKNFLLTLSVKSLSYVSMMMFGINSYRTFLNNVYAV